MGDRVWLSVVLQYKKRANRQHDYGDDCYQCLHDFPQVMVPYFKILSGGQRIYFDGN